MYKDIIIKSIKNVTGEELVGLEKPEREEFGDYSTNVAMHLKPLSVKSKEDSNPRQAAENIVKELEKDQELMAIMDKMEVAGPGFINFWIKPTVLLVNLEEILKKKDQYGSSDSGKGKTVVIDYSSPNIAKRFSIGHLRSTIIGQALYNLYGFQGYRTIGDNHLGDWGTQFGTLLHQIVSKDLDAENLSIEELEQLYVEFHRQADDDPNLQEEARKWFKKLEDGDIKAKEIWKILVDKSVQEFERVYGLLGVNIDHTYGESFYTDIMPSVINEAKEMGLAKLSQGALIIEIPEIKEPLILIKSDGGTTYATRDLATLKFRKDEWDPDIFIYEVGVEQTLHFRQVFAAARLLGYLKKEAEAVHTRHGWYLGEDGKKFSTRKGKTVKLEEILNEAMERAKKLSSGHEDLAKKVGVGAIKYFDLSHNIQSDIVFSWEKMFVLEGKSGPYLQYTYARTQSVLEKVKSQKSKVLNASQNAKVESMDLKNNIKDINTEEYAVLRKLSQFYGIIEDAAKMYSPNILADYLYDLAQKYNYFYNSHRIIDATEGEDVQQFRVMLTVGVGQVLKNGLSLLGITTPERM